MTFNYRTILASALLASASLSPAGAQAQCSLTFLEFHGPVLDQITWQLVDQSTNSVVCDGGPYFGVTYATDQCCLPDGCYKLKIMNPQGTGMGGGAYQVRVGSDPVLYGSNFGSLGEAPQPFCLPLGPNKFTSPSCDRLDLHASDVLMALPDADVIAQYGTTNTSSGYQFNFFNPNGGYNRVIFVSHANAGAGGGTGADRARRLKLSQIVVAPLPPNVLLNMRVRARVAGVDKPWGPTCTMMFDPNAVSCPHTNLVPTPGPTFSCGATGLEVSPFTKIYAEQAKRLDDNGNTQYANRYVWKFYGANGYQRSVATTSNVLTLGNWVSTPLLCGTNTYFVLLQTSFDNGTTYCPLGHACTLEVTNNTAACTPLVNAASSDTLRIFEDGEEQEIVVPGAQVWPNPSIDGTFSVRLAMPYGAGDEATVEILDPTGRLVLTEQVLAPVGISEHRLTLDPALANGLYLVNVAAGTEQYSTLLHLTR